MARKTNPLLEQEQRKAQQEMLVKQAQGIEQAKKTKLTLLLSEDDISKVKKIAIDRKTSVSVMVSEWIGTLTE